MKLPRSVIAFGIILASTVVAAPPTTAPDFPLDHVSTGTTVVDNITDITEGRQRDADQVATLIRNTLGKDLWAGEWRAAELSASPELLTIRSTKDVHEKVELILRDLRQQRNLYVDLGYQLVTADVTPEQAAMKTIVDPLKTVGFHVTRHVLDESHAIIRNGRATLLTDAVAAALPRIIATAVITADKKAATMELLTDDNSSAATAPTSRPSPLIFTLPFDLSAGIALHTAAGDQWLILKAQPIERHWTPLGIENLIERE